MIKFIRNDGEVLHLSDYFRILSIEGIGVLTQEIFTEKRAVGDGDIVTGTRVSSRTITITACNDHSGVFDRNRIKINAFFNPKNRFKIYITYKENTVWCDCLIDTKDLPTDNIYSPQMFVLSIYCPSPYLKSYDNFGKDLSSITPMFGWPLLSSSSKGFVTSKRNFSKRAFVPNDGAIETYCTAEIRIDATINDLKLYKNEQEFILFTTPLQSNQTVIIDFENRKILINGKSCPNYIDRRSTFFPIDRGGCFISYSASAMENAVHIFLYYNQLYLGV